MHILLNTFQHWKKKSIYLFAIARATLDVITNNKIRLFDDFVSSNWTYENDKNILFVNCALSNEWKHAIIWIFVNKKYNCWSFIFNFNEKVKNLNKNKSASTLIIKNDKKYYFIAYDNVILFDDENREFELNKLTKNQSIKKFNIVFFDSKRICKNMQKSIKFKKFKLKKRAFKKKYEYIDFDKIF